jgi:hypothetical protein
MSRQQRPRWPKDPPTGQGGVWSCPRIWSGRSAGFLGTPSREERAP